MLANKLAYVSVFVIFLFLFFGGGMMVLNAIYSPGSPDMASLFWPGVGLMGFSLLVLLGMLGIV